MLIYASRFAAKVIQSKHGPTEQRSERATLLRYMYIAYIPFSLRTKDYQFTCTQQKAPDTVRFTGHSRIEGPQYGTCFMSPFRCLEFRSGSYSCGKFVDL